MPRYIKTHRSKDLKRSTLVVSKAMLEELKKHGHCKMGDVYNSLKRKLGIHQKDFVYSLNFLYILGKIAYEKEYDMVRLIK